MSCPSAEDFAALLERVAQLEERLDLIEENMDDDDEQFVELCPSASSLKCASPPGLLATPTSSVPSNNTLSVRTPFMTRMQQALATSPIPTISGAHSTLRGPLLEAKSQSSFSRPPAVLKSLPSSASPSQTQPHPQRVGRKIICLSSPTSPGVSSQELESVIPSPAACDTPPKNGGE